MEDLIRQLYHNKLLSKFFHTSVYCLKRELEGCKSVLDLGCGQDSPLKHCNVLCSVGIDSFKPYLEISKKNKIHNKYILRDINKVKFRAKEFDAVILIGVLEHLSKTDGLKILKNIETWARKKIIISTPNGYLPQGDCDNNLYQRHRSGWLIGDMIKLGYKAYGMAGLKILRSKNVAKQVKHKEDIYMTIRFKPKLLWLIISEVTQAITYYFPGLAFEVFYVKSLRSN